MVALGLANAIVDVLARICERKSDSNCCINDSGSNLQGCVNYARLEPSPSSLVVCLSRDANVIALADAIVIALAATIAIPLADAMAKC